MPKYYLLLNFLTAMVVSAVAVSVMEYRTQVAEATGVCMGEAWVTGTRGNTVNTTIETDREWAMKIAQHYLTDPQSRTNICMGVKGTENLPNPGSL